jgi:hypothetical protein
MRAEGVPIKLRGRIAKPVVAEQVKASASPNPVVAEQVKPAAPAKKKKKQPRKRLPPLGGEPRRIVLARGKRWAKLPEDVEWVCERWGSPFRIETNEDKTRFKLVWQRRGLGTRRGRPAWFEYDTFADRRSAQRAIQEQLERWLREPEQSNLLAKIRERLRGKSVACLCREKTLCHGDVLLRLANEVATDEDATARSGDSD